VSSRGVIVVFAKAPRPGRVKTRMTPPLRPEQAAGLYAALLVDVLEATARVARDLGLEPIVAVYPPEARDEVACLAPRRFAAVCQRGADLSQRMAWAAREAAAGGARRVLLRGSDSPALDAETVGAVLHALDDVDLALCPDRDGGYNLVGVRRPEPALFEHPMSTSSVLEDTLANAQRLGLRARIAPASFDLDTAEDLRWLAEARSARVEELCPRTLDYLDRHALWPPPG
jgi:rSAM/selenodomain-associated transferase 1